MNITFLFLLILLTYTKGAAPPTEACPTPVEVEYGTGCLCTAGSCGTYSDPTTTGEEALLITTGRNVGFLKHETISVNSVSPRRAATMSIAIDLETKHQKILGFGAAITDAAAHSLTNILDEDVYHVGLEQAFVHAKFTFARVPMNSVDFSRMNYAMAKELDLSDFCLRDDTVPDGEPIDCGKDYKLRVLEDVVALAPDIKVYVSSWSAPPEFKSQNFTCVLESGVIACTPNPDTSAQVECVRTVADPRTCIGQPLGEPCLASPPNNFSKGYPLVPGLNPRYNPKNIPSKNANGNCYNSGFVREDAYEAWASMYAKFIEAYEAASVPIWGLTSQNEPFTQTGLWGSNFWNVEGLIDFVNYFLAPAVRDVNPDIQIIMYDDQYINLTDAASEMGRGTMDVSNGIGFHWYTSLESVYEDTEATKVANNLVGGGKGVKTLYEEFGGEKFLLMTESCSGYLLGTDFLGPRHGSFAYAYNTAHDLLWNMRNRASGYVYWNLILDTLGGPNLAGNYVDSPFYAVNATSFIINPSFYYLSHFSRFVPPGSFAVDASVNCGARYSEYCQFVAFQRPDEKVVVIMTNDKVTTTFLPFILIPRLAKGEGAEITWTVTCGTTQVSGTIPWQSIQTVVLDCGDGSSTNSRTEGTENPVPTSKSSTLPFKVWGAFLSMFICLSTLDG